MESKHENYRTADILGAGFLANVIMCHHRNPARKLRGLVKLIRAGHTAVTADFGLDTLLIDGHKASWCVLEEWAIR